MYLVIRDSSGQTFDGVVISLEKDRMRVALRDWTDTIELHRSYGEWYTETHDPVEFEALVGDASTAAVCAELFPAVLTALN
jgi:hypothetical protein